ncbi:MAG: PA14 domain-containing protein [Verrucomicrobiota bacterium]
MHRKIKALGICLGLMAVLAIQPAMGITTVVYEDFEGGLPGEVPNGWTAFGGTANFTPGIDDYRSANFGYQGGQTMALTNPFYDADGTYQVGVIFYNEPVNIRDNKLMIVFDLLISPGVSASPADGCAVMVLPKIPSAPGYDGGGMGWSGLGGFAVEFDIYDNGDPDPDDLVDQTEFQVAYGGDLTGDNRARQVGVDVARWNVTNDAVYSIITHDDQDNLAVYPNVPDFVGPVLDEWGVSVVVRVYIEYDNGFIKVDMESWDDSGTFPEFEFARDTVLQGVISPWTFHNEDCPEEAFVGFSGSCGGSNALQEVDNLTIQTDPNIGEPQYHDDIPPYQFTEIDPAAKVAEVGAGTELGWNVYTVKLNEEAGGKAHTLASENGDEALRKAQWALDNMPQAGAETSLFVNYASGVNAANANGSFENETGYPGIGFLPLDPPAEEQIDNFVVRATGYIEFPVAGRYYLGTTHDDGFTTMIGGKRIATHGGVENPTLYKFNVEEPGIYPIQVDLFEQGYYSYFSVFQTDGCGGEFTLINDDTQVKVYTDVPGGSIPPTDYGINIVTADPAEKVGEVGQGTNPGFAYKYRIIQEANNLGLPADLNSHVDAALYLLPPILPDAFTLIEDGVTQVVNWNGTATQAGNQPGDVALTGGDADDSFIRLNGFAEFPTAGMYALFIASDDGFELGIGSQQVRTWGNKGANDVAAFVNIDEPGLYPLELTWYERGGGNSVEFVQWTEAGATLVNSPDATVKVYQNAPGEANAVFLPNAWVAQRGGIAQKVADIGDCLESGFDVRFVKHPGGVGNLTQCEELLAGLREITSEDFSVQPFIDFWSSGGQGNFASGIPFPTLTADVDDDNFAIEATGFIELTAGWHMFGVNSDDGFDLRIGGRRVAHFQDAKGTSNVPGFIEIPETGIYPLRLSYWEGGGGAAAELYYVKPDLSLVLVNDTANGGPAVCTAIDGGGVVEAPVITSLTLEGGNVIVTWEGGTPPYQVQVTGELGAEWTNAGEPTTETSVAIPTTAAVGFLRVIPAGN